MLLQRAKKSEERALVVKVSRILTPAEQKVHDDLFLAMRMLLLLRHVAPLPTHFLQLEKEASSLICSNARQNSSATRDVSLDAGVFSLAALPNPTAKDAGLFNAKLAELHPTRNNSPVLNISGFMKYGWVWFRVTQFTGFRPMYAARRVWARAWATAYQN